MSSALLSILGDKKPPFKTLEDAAEAAADVLARLTFPDESDAEYARFIEQSVRRHLKARKKKGGGK